MNNKNKDFMHKRRRQNEGTKQNNTKAKMKMTAKKEKGPKKRYFVR